MFGISVIFQENAICCTPCGCGECDEELELGLSPDSGLQPGAQGDWLVHFLVPAKKFWDNIGFT